MENSSMANEVNFTSRYYDRIHQLDWLLPFIINIIVLAGFIWILISLVHYGIKTGKWRRVQRRSSEKLNAGFVYTSVIVCAVFGLLYCVISVLHLNVGFSADQDYLCDPISDLTKVFYILTVCSTYFFLWFRQRTFYTNRMLNVRFSKCVQVFSFLSIFLICLVLLAALIVFAIPHDTVASADGCSYDPNGRSTVSSTIFVAVAVLIFGQVSLLSLFINALVSSSHRSCFKSLRISLKCCKGDNQKIHSKTPPASVNTIANSTRNIDEERKKSVAIKIIIRKTLFFALLSIIIDIVALFTEFSVSKPGRTKRPAVLLGLIASSLNLLFIIFSFVSWKEMMTSPCRCKGDSFHSGSGNGSNQSSSV